MSEKKRRRGRVHSTIDDLPEPLKSQFEVKLANPANTYNELSEWLKGEGYLAKRYAVPLAPVPKVINKFSKDIAVYNLFSRIGIDEGTDQKTYLNRYNAAVKFLTLVAEGKVSIGADADGDPAAAAAIGFTVKSNPRLFSRGQMRGM